MTTFFRIFEQAQRPEHRDDPAWAERRFRALVDTSPMRNWMPGDPITRMGVRLLIGVATWSALDMRLLDVISDALRKREDGPTVEVFDTAKCADQAGFLKFFPKCDMVLQTPVVGVWRNGVFSDRAQGKRARDLIGKLLGVSSQDILDYVEKREAAHAGPGQRRGTA